MNSVTPEQYQSATEIADLVTTREISALEILERHLEATNQSLIGGDTFRCHKWVTHHMRSFSSLNCLHVNLHWLIPYCAANFFIVLDVT